MSYDLRNFYTNFSKTFTKPCFRIRPCSYIENVIVRLFKIFNLLRFCTNRRVMIANFNTSINESYVLQRGHINRVVDSSHFNSRISHSSAICSSPKCEIRRRPSQGALRNILLPGGSISEVSQGTASLV